MTERRSISAPDIPEHGNPIPAASRIGNLLFSSVILGLDPATHAMPDSREAQIANAFGIVRAILREAGGGPEHIGKLTVYLADRGDREFVNPYWLEMFPDAASRPARHTLEKKMPPGCYVQLEFIAVL